MRFGFRSAKLTLGIDVGSFSLKVVKLDKTSSGFKTVKIATARLSGPDSPGEDEILSTLKDLLERTGLMHERASLILPGREAMVRYFTLPRMPHRELAQAVAWEAAKHASLPPEDLVTDFVAYESKPGLPEGRLQTLAVMAPRATVDRWVANSSRIGLRLAAIDIPAMALLAYCDLSDPWASRGSIAIIDLGHSRTGIHIFQGGHLCFTRDIAIGGNDISQALSDVLHVDYQRAEHLKERLGLTGEGQEGAKARQIVEQVLERIAVEVQRSFDYYQAQYREASFTAIRLAGGTALLSGIARYFSEALRLETSVDEPWQFVPLAPEVAREEGLKALGPIFSSGIGAATRGSPR